MSKTKIRIDYSKCGEKGEIDPRDCTKCLKACDPCVFLMHETIGVKEENIYDPQNKTRFAVPLRPAIYIE